MFKIQSFVISYRRKTTEAVSWMKFFLERVGDYMPHNNKIYVPPAYNFKILYDRMQKDFRARGLDDLICYGHFTNILHRRLPDFVLGKVSLLEFSIYLSHQLLFELMILYHYIRRTQKDYENTIP